MKNLKYILIIVGFLFANQSTAELTWSVTNMHPSFLGEGRRVGVAFAEDSSGNCYFLLDTILYRSTNDGIEWKVACLGLKGSNHYFGCTKNGIVIVSYLKNGRSNNIYSTDYGITFQNINKNDTLPSDSVSYSYSILVKEDTLAFFQQIKHNGLYPNSYQNLLYTVYPFSDYLQNDNFGVKQQKTFTPISVDKNAVLYLTGGTIHSMQSLTSEPQAMKQPDSLYLQSFGNVLLTENNELFAFSVWDNSLNVKVLKFDKGTNQWDTVTNNLVRGCNSYGMYKNKFYTVSPKYLMSSNIDTIHFSNEKTFNSGKNTQLYISTKGTIFMFDSLGLVWRGEQTTDNVDIDVTTSFSIFPNPATDYIEISVPVEARHALPLQIRIYDVFGREVNYHKESSDTPPNPLFVEGEKKKVDVSGWPVGMYFVWVGGRVGRFLKI